MNLLSWHFWASRQLQPGQIIKKPDRLQTVALMILKYSKLILVPAIWEECIVCPNYHYFLVDLWHTVRAFPFYEKTFHRFSSKWVDKHFIGFMILKTISAISWLFLLKKSWKWCTKSRYICKVNKWKIKDIQIYPVLLHRFHGLSSKNEREIEPVILNTIILMNSKLARYRARVADLVLGCLC